MKFPIRFRPRPRRIADYFANFAIMKKSLAYLPENKQRDLRQLTEIIRREIVGCEMIILFGSYARNKYVDYDQRTEFGVRTYFMSDYDILILTEKRIVAAPDEIRSYSEKGIKRGRRTTPNGGTGKHLSTEVLAYAQVSPIRFRIGHNKDWQLLYLY